MTHFLCKVDPKKTIFKRLYQMGKLLILIVSPNIFHWKSAKEINVGLVFGAKYGPN